MQVEDEHILVESAKQDAENFGKLYDYYFPKVYAFVRAKVSDQSCAEDITSDIFMKIVEHLKEYEFRGLPFGAWVFRIARNTLHDFYAKNAKIKTTDIEKASSVRDETEQNSPHGKATHQELALKVKEVLKNLPERDMTVIQLKFFSGLNNREITGITGLSESNVGIIVYRTLKKIRPDLQYFVT